MMREINRIQNALTPGAGTSMAPRDLISPQSQKQSVTDRTLITPPSPNREVTQRSVQSSKNQKLVMAGSRDDDQQGPPTSRSRDDLVHPTRPLGILVENSGSASVHTRSDERLMAPTISKAGQDHLTEREDTKKENYQSNQKRMKRWMVMTEMASNERIRGGARPQYKDDHSARIARILK